MRHVRLFIQSMLLAVLFLPQWRDIHAAPGSIDTLITGNGTPGPYLLGNHFIDRPSLMVERTDSGYLPQYTFVRSVNGLLFSAPIDSSIKIHVSFSLIYQGITRIYSLYEKRYKSAADSLSDSNSFAAVTRQVIRDDNLAISGFKSMGVSIGSFGQVNFEQGLDVRIGGEIRPGTELSAHLNDQGTSLDGATREISDFDRIYVTLSDPHFKIVAGDQYIQWPFSGILTGQKKIKGIAASLQPGPVSVSAFGALGGGNFTVQTWRGELGQGPYPFRGNGEAGFIMPIRGTIHLTINGATCEEGFDKAYTIDYDLGTITFSTKYLIRPEDLIRAEYEYKTFDYQRTVAGTALSSTLGDSLVTIEGALWTETDNKNNPIDLVLTDDNIRTLKKSGDHAPLDTAAYLVNRNDVLDRYASVPLYARTDSAGTVIFVYREPDHADLLKNDSLYEVHFTISDSCGDYTRTILLDEYVYRYVGPCAGTYSPLTPLRTPVRQTSGELQTRLTTSFVKARIDVAGQEYDRNLFSSSNDDDNLASALSASALIGKKSTSEKALWLDGTLQYYSERFNREAVSASERKTSWNDTALSESTTGRTLWEVIAGFTPVSTFTSAFTYGQQRSDNLLTTDKAGMSATFRPQSFLSGSYSGNYFRHYEAAKFGTGHRQDASISTPFRLHGLQLFGHDEWRESADKRGSGLLEGRFAYTFFPLDISQELTYTSFRSGSSGLYRSIDTADAVSWMQRLDVSPLAAWRINGNSTWQLRRSLESLQKSNSTTLLIDLKSSTGSSASPFSSTQHFHTTAERASRYIQVPTYVGQGRGTHLWDSTLMEYTPDPQGAGDFIIRQTEALDSTNNSRTRKSMLAGTWGLRKGTKSTSGILDDLTWEGTLTLEEHLDAATPGIAGWLPGYRSLRSLTDSSKSWNGIRYSDLVYTQDIGWTPSFNPSLEAQLSIRPAFSFIRSYREPSLTLEAIFSKEGPRYSSQTTFRHYSLQHDDTSSSTTTDAYSLRDLSLSFRITRHLPHDIDLSLAPVAGWGQQKSRFSSVNRKLFDSTLYGQITPEARMVIPSRGSLSAAYTFSIVGIPPDHDYRIAGGFSTGLSHTLTFNGNVRAGKYFVFNGSYRGEMYGRSDTDRPSEHVMSLEVQAYLQ